jgi:hypothetical protein
MGKKLSSKSKEVLVDEEVSLSIIENHEFVAMRAGEKLWPIPTTTEDQLHELVSDGLIQEKDCADWKIPSQHQVPTLVLVRLSCLSLLFELVSACLPLLFFIVSSNISGFA